MTTTTDIIADELLHTLRLAPFEYEFEIVKGELNIRLWEMTPNREKNPVNYVRGVIEDNTVRFYAVQNRSANGVQVVFTNTYPNLTVLIAVVNDLLASVNN